MSYLHCPTCKRAFNLATSSSCPSCPVAAQIVDAAEDIVAATEQLARAMARATPDERADAMARMDRLALPAPGAKPVTFHGAMVKSIREALDPSPQRVRVAARSGKAGPFEPTPPPRPARKPPLLERFANRMLAELAPRIARYAPQARDMRDGLRARMRALTA